MNVKDRDDARKILSEIDALSESAALMNDTIKRLQESGGKAKLLVYTGEEKSITELDVDTAGIVMRDIIRTYNGLITLNKSKIEAILRDTLVTIN